MTKDAAGAAKPTALSRDSSTVFTVARPISEISMSTLLALVMKMGETVKSNPVQIAGDYVNAAVGPGGISPDDFIRLRLFDKMFLNGADAREFIGAKRHRSICFTVNYRHDWLGMLSNKAASMSYLQSYGLPTIPIKAIYAPYTNDESPHILSDKNALEHFLLRADAYPLFGKPVEGLNSLGSVALASCSPSTREVSMGTGARIKAEYLANEIDAHYHQAGYLFQEWASPHPAIKDFCGERLATVRFMTIATETDVQIFRACWKIPSGGNTADNYWREGNLLAQLDMVNGRILRVTSGAGLDMREHTIHPDTNVPLVGFAHPQWEEMKALALRGARLMMRTTPLIGWDVACTNKGPVVVEMNEHPDSFLMQFADRRGILNDTFRRFIAFQKQNYIAFQADIKRAAKV